MTGNNTLVWLVVAVVAIGAVGAVGAYTGGVPTLESDGPSEPIAFDDDPVELEAAHPATLEGETTLDDGTELQIRLRASGDQPFLMVETTTVEDGAVSAEFDLSDAEPGQELNVTVHDRDGEHLYHTDGIVVEAEADDGGDGGADGNADGGAGEGDTHDSVDVTVHEASTELPAATNATVNGDTDAEAGTEVLVRLQSTGDEPFLYTNTTEVDADGSFETQFDLFDVEPEAEAELLVQVDETTTDVAVTVVEADWEPSVADEHAFEVTFEEEPVELPATENATLSGETELEGGTEMMVRLRASGDQPFLKSNTTTVGDDGSFEVAYNLTSAEPGQEATIVLYANDDDSGSFDAEVVASEG